MDVAGSVALVTGANRGLGAGFCRALLARGASKVYAGARDPDTIGIAGVVPVRLDITSPVDTAAAAAQCDDTTLLVNNAGILTGTSVLADDALEGGRREFDTNVFGTLSMSRAFAPVLGANGGLIHRSRSEPPPRRRSRAEYRNQGPAPRDAPPRWTSPAEPRPVSATNRDQTNSKGPRHE